MEEINWFAGYSEEDKSLDIEYSNLKNENIIEDKYQLVKSNIKNFEVITISTIQRKFEVGYAIGCVVVERLEAEGFVQRIPNTHQYLVIKK